MTSFIDATRGAPAHPSLHKALDLWTHSPGLALDLGCGAGRDSLALLRAGWKVVALDRDPEALRALQEQAAAYAPGALTALCRTFEDAAPLPAVDLINASFALPFCRPEAFTDLWMRITQALRQGGLFTGHFFGPRDDWAKKGLSIHSQDQLRRQFERWELLALKEFDYDGTTAMGRAKHWQMFEVIARPG
ncbi:class I SAM-dependent methyltransferase [Pseudomonas stutzeri]|uniref:class I SAM-dependent methyltransferase n=1 Tax=Stutzerimonas stutzeri TaxID=316 RepID=UPI00210E4E94|nr:class I SAM-dependent methyltransferase [Stutzerimonas stutzeri]MCQ4287951.1 class I SAM-dependent methyltransferase [Stutzerimonas stutzeri]